MTRDYLTVKVWDLNMENRPIETYQVCGTGGHPGQPGAHGAPAWAGSSGGGHEPGGGERRAINGRDAGEGLLAAGCLWRGAGALPAAEGRPWPRARESGPCRRRAGQRGSSRPVPPPPAGSRLPAEQAVLALRERLHLRQVRVRLERLRQVSGSAAPRVPAPGWPVPPRPCGDLPQPGWVQALERSPAGLPEPRTRALLAGPGGARLFPPGVGSSLRFPHTARRVPMCLAPDCRNPGMTVPPPSTHDHWPWRDGHGSFSEPSGQVMGHSRG